MWNHLSKPSEACRTLYMGALQQSMPCCMHIRAHLQLKCPIIMRKSPVSYLS